MPRSAKTKHVMNLVGAVPQNKNIRPPAVKEISADAQEEGLNDDWGVKAVIPEIINRELYRLAERFHIEMTDSNLWELTKTALEEVRPCFAFSDEELEEKAGAARGDVIKSMTKAAMKISANKRKK